MLGLRYTCEEDLAGFHPIHHTQKSQVANLTSERLKGWL